MKENVPYDQATYIRVVSNVSSRRCTILLYILYHKVYHFGVSLPPILTSPPPNLDDNATHPAPPK